MQRHQFRRHRAQGKHQHTRGFTMLELAVSITIIALLAAILMPAVQSVRESSRRTGCQNHLRQLGVAILAFESTHGEYPRLAGPLSRPLSQTGNFGDTPFRGYSPHAQLLPYLDQTPLASQIDYQEYAGELWNPAGRESHLRTVLAVFKCPSNIVGIGTNYRGCTGEDAARLHGSKDGGVFGRHVSGTRVADITDGTSNTCMMSEKLRSDANTGRFSVMRDFWYTGLEAVIPGGWNGATPDEVVQTCRSLSGNPPSWYPYAGWDWLSANFEWTLYNHVTGPNSAVPDCSDQSSLPNSQLADRQPGRHPGLASGSFRATSAHAGGVYSLFADGAVRFVADGIDLTVWRGTATINGREI